MAKEEKRKAILQAAERLFLSRRFDQVTLEDVRLKARVGKGTIYRYFKDKDDLFAQVILAGSDELFDLIKGKTDRARSTDQKLLAVAKALRDFYRKRKPLFRSLHSEWVRNIMKREDLREQLRKGRNRTVALVASVIRDGKGEGIYRSDLTDEAAAHVFLAVVRGPMWAGCGKRPKPVPIERLVNVFLNGMRKR